MIKIEDIIEAISKDLNTTLVLHRSIERHRIFEIYKIYSYVVYNVVTNERLLTFQISERLHTDNVEENWNIHDKQFIETLINWISSNTYKQLKNDRVK